MNTPKTDYETFKIQDKQQTNLDFWIYKYHDKLYIYNEYWIHDISWDSYAPHVTTLLDEWYKQDDNNLTEETKEQIIKMQNAQKWKILAYEQIKIMLHPNLLESDFNTLIWNRSFTKEEKEKIIKAKDIMKKLHENQFRDEWLPYYVHPLKITNDLLKDNKSYETIICWLLHDVIEDNKNVNIDELKEIFWEKIINTILILTKIEKETGKKINNEEYLQKISSNQIAITVKWYDRINNIASTYFSTQEKRERYIKETEEFYIPFFEKYSPKIANDLKEILKYIKTNPKPTEKEQQQIKQAYDSYMLVNKINKETI